MHKQTNANLSKLHVLLMRLCILKQYWMLDRNISMPIMNEQSRSLFLCTFSGAQIALAAFLFTLAS